MVTDTITNWFFTNSADANDNLRRSGVSNDRLFFFGNTMIDTLLHHKGVFRKPTFFGELWLKAREYLVVTAHRPANVNRGDGFSRVLDATAANTPGLPGSKPRMAESLLGVGAAPASMHILDLEPYLEFNHLVKNPNSMIADSGRITEEATVLGIPHLHLRDGTERPETVTIGTDELIRTDPSALKPALDRLFAGKWRRGAISELRDVKRAPLIVAAREGLLADRGPSS